MNDTESIIKTLNILIDNLTTIANREKRINTKEHIQLEVTNLIRLKTTLQKELENNE